MSESIVRIDSCVGVLTRSCVGAIGGACGGLAGVCTCRQSSIHVGAFLFTIRYSMLFFSLSNALTSHAVYIRITRRIERFAILRCF
jgi:NhaP-type Na+/H+ and K+/H+ antiporter